MPPKPIDPKGKRPASKAPPESHQTGDEDQDSSVTPGSKSGSPNPDSGPGTSGTSDTPPSPPTNPPGQTIQSNASGQPPNDAHTPTPIVSELAMIPINLWSDSPLRRASNNWKQWSSQMTLILRTYKAYAYVEGNEIRPNATDLSSFSNWRTNHFMVCAFMLSAIEVNERYDYSQYSRADELWKVLMGVYDVTGIMSKMDAMSQLMSMSFTWNVPVTEHYRTIINLANTIFQDGPLSKDDLILHSLLLSLNNDTAKDDMKHARTLLDSKPNAGHNDVYHSLCIAESERKFRETKNSEMMAFLANAKASSTANASSTNKSKLVCANCKRKGHEEAFCIRPNGGMEGKTLEEARAAQRAARDEGKGKAKEKDRKSFKLEGKAFFVNDGKVYSVDESGNVFMITETIKDVASFVTDSLCQADLDELSLTLDDTSYSLSEPDFLLDTGCTVHMSPFASDFDNIHPTSNRRVTGVNGNHVEAVGIGNISIRTPSSSITLHNALYIPTASVRLISVAALMNSIHGKITFDNEKATIIDARGNVIAHGTRLPDRNLWRLDGTPTPHDRAFISTVIPTLDVWHKRLGHSNNQSIYEMATKDLAEGMPIDTSLAPRKCDHCILGKQTRSSIPSQRRGERSKRRLGIVYVDLSGPEEVTSASGNNYFMSIIDDYSNYIWTFPIPHKSDAFFTLKAWALRVERECDAKIGIIRTDNGELRSMEMKNWCVANGYSQEFTAPYTSAHIGKVERVHRTIMNKARTMRIQTVLPPNRWDEFVKTATYLTVRTLTRSTGKTPYEGWYDRKPNLSNLREIGARSFALILNKNNPKILARSIECILIGYSDDSNAYRLYHRPTHKIITSAHVNFIESFQARPPDIQNTTVTPKATSEEEDINTANLVAIGEKGEEEKLTKKERKKIKAERRKWRKEIQRVVKNEEDIGKEEEKTEDQSFSSVEINPQAPNDPKSLEEALSGPESHLWKPSIQDELNSLKEREVYRLVSRSSVPTGRNVLTSKWVLVTKHDGRKKSRCVARGFQQIYGLDFTDTTSPTTRLESLRILLHLAAINDLDVNQLDIKTAYLYGILPEEEYQYMEQPKGFEEEGREDWVWELRKGLYGMKQSGRVWNKTLNEALEGWGFMRLQSEPCGYRRVNEAGTVDACVHVDDFLYVPTTKEAYGQFLKDIGSNWEFSDLGEARYCVGISFVRNRVNKTIGLSQESLISKIASSFLSDTTPIYTPMDPNSKLARPKEPASDDEQSHLKSLPYRSLIGSMMYVATGTRPDIAYTIAKLSQFLDCYREEHWEAALRCARYLLTTKDMKLWLGGDKPPRLIGYSDSSYADCVDTRKSSMGYCFSLGSGIISWNSKKQKTVSSSTTEAEYIACGEATREAIWLRNQLSERGIKAEEPTTIFCDNNGAMTLAKDPIQHARNKHIEVRHHFIREKINDRIIDIWRVPSKFNIADILTKPLVRYTFERLRKNIGVE